LRLGGESAAWFREREMTAAQVAQDRLAVRLAAGELFAGVQHEGHFTAMPEAFYKGYFARLINSDRPMRIKPSGASIALTCFSVLRVT
jgi:hypothetical protein